MQSPIDRWIPWVCITVWTLSNSRTTSRGFGWWWGAADAAQASIQFSKQNKGRFHIGVMRTDGSEERLLTASFLDEGPTWSPNGRVIMFTRETRGAAGASSLYSVDVSGRNLKPVKTNGGGSDPSWSPLQ